MSQPLTPQELNFKTIKLRVLRKRIKHIVDTYTMSIINEIVDLELEIEKECNQ